MLARKLFLFVAVTAALTTSGVVYAAPLGTAFTIQGRFEQDGAPVTGTADINFRLYDAVSGGSLVDEMSVGSVTVTDGLFETQIDFGAEVFDGDALWIEIEVEFPSGSGGWTTLSPRIPVTATPYALQTRGLYVNAALQVGIGTTKPSVPLHVVGFTSPVVRVQNMGISSGTAISASGPTRGIYGGANAQTGSTVGVEGYSASPNGSALNGFNEAESGNAYAVYGENISPDGIAIYGIATADDEYSTGVGVYGLSRSDYDGTGVYGEATTTGTTYGVRGVSTYGIGVRGEQTTSGNVGALGRTDEGVYGRGFGGADGVYGIAAGTGNLDAGIGVHGESKGPASGIGVLGEWDGDTAKGMGYGGFFLTTSPHLPALVGQNFSYAETDGAIGVYGYAASQTGDNFGVYAVASGTHGQALHGEVSGAGGGGYAVYGVNQTASNYTATAIYGERVGHGVGVEGLGGSKGVYGHVDPAGATGIYYGVLGVAQGGTGTSYGVFGDAAGAGSVWAGYFGGNVQITGILFKGAGAFKIDHPLDPENKYLYHSFVESPDMKNIYDGVVVTNARGYATVSLPEWFETLNRDFRYQLTILDEDDNDDFVIAKVVRKMQDNQFTIRTSAPNIEVSWMVTGIRHDPYAEANRIPVEADKTGDEVGTYLNPEVWGKPIDLRIDRVREAEAQRVISAEAAELIPVQTETEERGGFKLPR